MIKINGVDIATPKTYEATVTDLDGETNRNANGEMIRDRIAVKRKLNLEWGPLTQAEIQTLHSKSCRKPPGTFCSFGCVGQFWAAAKTAPQTVGTYR